MVVLLAGTVSLALAGCGRPQAVGPANGIVVGVPEPQWEVIAEQIGTSIEPRIFTVRDERIFEVSHVDPASDGWQDMRKVRQVLVIGEPGDPWVAPVLDRAGGSTPAPPSVVQARDVWAMGQSVTAILLPANASADDARPLIEEAGDSLVRQYERYARSRMFTTGVDSALADSLRSAAGFSMLVPRVYRLSQPIPDVVVFRNDNPDPSQLIRQVDVTWRPSAQVERTAPAVLAWRSELAGALTDPPQVTESERVQTRRLQVGGREVLEVQSTWSNPPGAWPAGGPFITRLVECGERIFLVDAWLYAPGAAKYEYMVQLETILNTFDCAA